MPPELRLDAKRAVPLALLLTELVGGVLRQRPEGGRNGPLRLSVGAMDGRLRATLQGQDEAAPAGLPAGGLPAGGLGDTVLRAMARQLGALLWQEDNAAAGRRLVLEMPLEPPDSAPAPTAEQAR